MAELSTGSAQVDVADGTTMGVFWAGVSDGVRRPGMIVFQEAFGVNSHIRDVARRFAREGFFAVAPELFHRTGPGVELSYTDFAQVRPHMTAVTPATLEADSRAAYAWMSRQAMCDHSRIGAVGFCMGGKAAYVANAVLPLKTAVSFYGGGIAPDLLPMAATQQGSILLIWGGADQHILAAHRRAIADALAAAKKSYINLVFADADHAFFCDERKNYHDQSSREAWALTREFLKGRFGA